MAVPELSIVIPAYNEEQRLLKTLQRIASYFSRQTTLYEIIVVDDGSSDQTRTVVQASGILNVRLIVNKKNRGKGASVQRGVSVAKGKKILFTDADLSTPIEEYSKLEARMAQGAAVVIASRALPESVVNPHQPFYREAMGRFFNRLVQLVVLPGIHDTQCGFKLFERAIARKIFSKLTIFRFGFDVELLFLARQAGATVAEVPVNWENALGSKVSPIRDSGIMFLDLFRIRWRHWKKSGSSFH